MTRTKVADEKRAPRFVRASRDEIAGVVAVARDLVAAHENRSPTSAHATLGELSALFDLSWRLNRLGKKP